MLPFLIYPPLGQPHSVFGGSPDMTFTVNWALKPKYISIPTECSPVA